MKVIDTGLPGVRLLEPRVHGDERGFFLEAWNAETFAQAGLSEAFVQDNHSRSARGVLRGLHYQIGRPQAKLVRAAAGRIYDVAVDLRRSSPTFGRWVGAELSDRNMHMLWIPAGFAHGFLSLEDGSDVHYKCSDFYAPEHERALLWSDPGIAIDWPLAGLGAPLVTSRDAAAPTLEAAELYE